MSQSASVTLQFGESDSTLGPTKTDPKKDEFIPSVWPWMYDPSYEPSYMNLIDSCDKWVLEPWSGFDLNEIAKDYRDKIIKSAKDRLPKAYEEAKATYFKEWQDFVKRQMEAQSTNTQTTYNSQSTNKEVSVNFTIATAGVANSSSSYYGGGSGKPKVQVDIRFGPEADAQNQNNQNGNNGNKGKKCSILPWQMFYLGEGAKTWCEPFIYEQWKDDHTVGTIQKNWYVDGAADTNGDEPNKNVKWWNGSKFVPFFCYYDTGYNPEKYPNYYAMHDIRFNWNKIIAPTETLSVYDLVRLWYIPDPINPLPVESGRITKVPLTFPAGIKSSTIYMHLALGYVPPSGMFDAKTSWRTGVTFDLKGKLKYHPDTGDNLGGRVEVLPFDFSGTLGSSFIKYGNVKDEQWGQHGEHYIEVINLGSEAAIELQDTKYKIGKKQTLRKYYDMQYYVPKHDTGEYLYRKKWAVINPLVKKESDAFITITYMKQYGHLGCKMVVELANPFDKDVVLYWHGWGETSCVDNGTVNLINSGYLILIPKSTNHISTKQVTLYSAWNPEFKQAKPYEGSYFFLPDIATRTSRDNTYSVLETYSRATLLADGVHPISYKMAKYLKDDADKNICQLPEVPVLILKDAIKEPVNDIELPAIADDVTGLPASRGIAGVGLQTGIPCTWDGWYKDYRGAEPSWELRTGIKGFFRRTSKSYFQKVIGSAGFGDSNYSHLKEAYISPDIDTLYHRAPNVQRYTLFDYQYFNTHDGSVYPLGGSTKTFCHANDKQNTFNVEMAIHTNLVSKNASGLLISNDPDHSIGYFALARPSYAYWNESKRTVPNNWDEPFPAGDFDNGGGALTTYYINSVYPDASSVATHECVFRARVVDGWDNTAIEVILADYEYYTTL